MYLVANDQIYSAYTVDHRAVMSCGTYKVATDVWEWPPKYISYILPMSAPNPSLRVASRYQYMGGWGEPEDFQWQHRTITMPLEEWKTYEEEFELEDWRSGVDSTLVVRVTGFEAFHHQ
jgi:hypothetical protein